MPVRWLTALGKKRGVFVANSFYIKLKTQHENLGDLMIAKASIEYLGRFGRVFLNTNGCPREYVELFKGIERIELTKRPFISILLGNPGAIFCYKLGGYFSFFSWKAEVKGFLVFIYFIFCKILFGKVIKLPHSFGYEKKLPLFEKMLLNYVVIKVMARDVSTFNTYVRLGVNQEKISFCPDCAFYYFEKVSTFSSGRDGDPEEGRSRVSMSFRFDRDKDFITHVVLKIKERLPGYLVGVVSQVKFDNQFLIDVTEKSSVEVFGHYDMSTNSIDNIVSSYRCSAYVISNRLHALLLGVLNGAIPIAVVDRKKDSKVYEVISQLYPENIVFYNGLRPEDVATNVEMIISKGKGFRVDHYDLSKFYSRESFFGVADY